MKCQQTSINRSNAVKKSQPKKISTAIYLIIECNLVFLQDCIVLGKL